MPKQVFMDMHTHIIPGVDDGSNSMEETMKMLKQAYDDDIRVIIATPHYGVINPDYDGNEATKLLRNVRKKAKELYPDLHVLMGNEIYYTQGIVDDLNAGKAKTIGMTSYVLVEFNMGVDYETMRRAIDEFIFNGYRVIIAHIERYACLEDDIELVEELIGMGAYMQMNCRSLLGGKRKSGFSLENRAAWCRKLIRGGCVHFLASDCHNSGIRRPMMKTAVKTVLNLTDDETVQRIIRKNILHLMRDEEIAP